MLNMNVPKPYQGKEKFIFISYSHRDTAKVFPIIFNLMENGYRVWYDQGIDPGTEWDENIATHIDTCGYFIAFMSSNYLGSNNCKDELNYARDLEKDRLIVYLEEVTLPAGMAMRVNRLQSIFKYTYTNEADFYEKLFAASNIDVCLGEKPCENKPCDNNAAPAQDFGAVFGGAGSVFGGNYNGAANQQNGTSPSGNISNPTTSANGAYNPQNGQAQNGQQWGNTAQNNGADVNNPYSNITFINQMSRPVKSKIVAALLAIFLGGLGIHKFYLGKKLLGVLYLIFCWTYIPGILGVVDAILILTSTDENFMKKYNCRIG